MTRTTRAACIFAALLAAMLTALTTSAFAGQYKQYTCKLPDGSPAATDGWTADSDAAFFRQSDACDAGSGLVTQMDGAGFSAGVQRRWRWTTAPNTTLEALDIYRVFLLTTGNNTATPTERIDSGSQLIEREGSSPVSGTGISSRGNYNPWDADENHVSVSNRSLLSANELTVSLGCSGAAGASCPATGATSEVRLHAAHFTLGDASTPSVIGIGGSLAADGPKSGVQTLSISASDTGSGVYRAFLDVDGVTTATFIPNANGGKCADAVPGNDDPYEFQHRVPCPLQLGIDVPLDTRGLADGNHVVQVRVEDAAGNKTTAFGPRTIAVNNAPAPTTPPPGGGTPGTGTPGNPGPGTPGTPGADGANGAPGPNGGAGANGANGADGVNGTNGGPGARLSVAVLNANQRSVLVRFGKRPTLSGRVTTSSGAPVAGATVDVLAQTRVRGSALKRIATVRTDAAGGFRYVVPAGPSRLVRFGYRARTSDPAYSQTRDIDVRVRGKVSLRVSRNRLRNGQTIRYSGRVFGISTRRPLVQVQVRSRSRWINVCVIRSRARGRFSCKYRFQRTRTPTTYVFRALVRKQDGLPYETAASARRAVRVRP